VTGDDREFRRGEYRVLQVDPDTGRITDTVEENWLLAPIHGLRELVSDVAHRRLGTGDLVFLVLIAVLIGRGAS